MRLVFVLALLSLAAAPRWAQADGPAPRPLVTVRGQDLRFGTSVYPYRSRQDPEWLVEEARELGLTELRVSFPRDRVERCDDDSVYREENYRDPHPEILDLLRRSGMDLILCLEGPHCDAAGKHLDWPRNPDGTVDGRASAAGFANYAEWTVRHTGEFARAYELLNESFNVNFDLNFGKKGFGPGGSLENADNYSAMCLSALRRIKSIQPEAKVAVEGNYWNLERSVEKSPSYQQLLKEADFAVIHPYGYRLHAYEGPGAAETEGNIFAAMSLYPRYNPSLRFWWTEYGAGPRELGLKLERWSDAAQGKALLRATVLHLSHGIQHLDAFCMYYPTSPVYTLIDDGAGGKRVRRPAWSALRRFLAAAGAGRESVSAALKREADLPAGVLDLAIAREKGFLYLVWQETPPQSFEEPPKEIRTTVELTSSDRRRLALDRVMDPLTGEAVAAEAAAGKEGGLSITLPVADVPLLCELRLEGGEDRK